MSNTILFKSAIDTFFSDNYLAVRKIENRILSDFDVENLPNIVANNVQEWQFRKESSNRLYSYILAKKRPLKILDLGCGNGWFSNLMSKIEHCKVTAIDINLMELEQANAVFKNESLQFVYADIFKLTNSDYNQNFDMITLNGCVQYFPNLKKLLEKLNSFLTPQGEIHIFDSPFYLENNVDLARKNTMRYYTQLGFPEMSTFYFHHLYSDLEPYHTLYRPKKSLLNFFKKQNPFCWFVIYVKSM